MKLTSVSIFLLLTLFTTNLFANYESSVVRISSTGVVYDYKNPWKTPKQKSATGSGVIIQNNYILTAAHVVAGAKTIEVRKSASRKKYYAFVKYISPQADLALLQLYEKSFFKNTQPLKLGFSAKKGDAIKVIGYPLGATKLVTKKGKLSKVLYYNYALSNENLLAYELKTNIQEGFSGGAVVDKTNQLIALAMQIPQGKSKRAYAIPALMIYTFFKDIADGKVDGYHSNENAYQYLKNEALQNYYKIDAFSILVNQVDIHEQQLQKGDIIFAIDGKKFTDTSIVKFLSHFHAKPIGETLGLTLLRDGKELEILYRLHRHKPILYHEFESKPRYMTLGGLVFAPLTRNYLQAVGIKQYEMNLLFYGQSKHEMLEERVVWIEKKFNHPINKGYNSKIELVNSVNGIQVKSFEHFVKLIDSSLERYIVIDFMKSQQIILDKKEALKSLEEIKKQYKLTKTREIEGRL